MDWLDRNNALELLEDLFYDVDSKEEIPNSKLIPKKADGSLDFESFVQLILKHWIKKLTRQSYPKLPKREKCNQLSKEYREEGNEIFKSARDDKRMEVSLRLYTKSIAFAVSGSEAMALSYANRSAVLEKFHRPVESLEDIERALLNNYPDKLKPKLLFRRANCYKELANENYIHAKFWLNNVPLNDPICSQLVRQLKSYRSMTEREKIIDEGEIIPEVKSPSSKYTCASDAIEVCYSTYYGRHIVATRDIDPGEILVVEKNFTQFISYELYAYCNYCYKFLWNGIPCEQCINVVYCSEKCRAAAWNEYHSMDCTLFDLCIQHKYKSLNQTHRLLFRMIHEAEGGWQELKQRFKKLPDAPSKNSTFLFFTKLFDFFNPFFY